MIIIANHGPTFYVLNETASLMWRLLDEPRSVEYLTRALAEACDVEAHLVENDVLAFIKSMPEKDMIVAEEFSDQ